MKIKKFNKMPAIFCIASIIVNVCIAEAYKSRVSVLAVENRFALVQLGFDISDALNMEYIVFDSTSSDFANNIVYVWNDGINDWVKTTMPAFLNGSLFYNKSVNDVLVITDSLNSIQKFGARASWAPKMFVIDKLEYPNILNSINDKYKFTPSQWNIFSEKYNVKVENVATNSSRYSQPLWDFSLPSFTVEARQNSANADLTPKELKNSSVEVLIVDTEFLSSTDEDVMVDDEPADEEVVIVRTTEVVATNNKVKVVESVETDAIVEEPVVEEKDVKETESAATNITESPVIEKAVETSASTQSVSVVDEKISAPASSNNVISSPVVKPVEKTQIEASVEEPVVKETNVVEKMEEEVVEEDVPAAPEVDSNMDQIKIEL
jgi:hypothetical protein